MTKRVILKNTSMLYLLNLAKIVFPFLTFPYLTRVLSVDGYALVMYVRAAMQYMQIGVDFGFMLSATKHIVRAKNNRLRIGHILSDTVFARLLLACAGGIVLVLLTGVIPLLRQHILYTALSFVSVVISCFFVDYLFRGLEQMHEITLRFVLLRGLATVLTFVLVHSDEDIMIIPCLDIVAFLVAVLLVRYQIKKYQISFYCPRIRRIWFHLKDSFQYFISDIATTAFGALNTLLVGLFLPIADVALWTVAMQIVSAIQMFYTPITNGIYPEMIRHKRWGLIQKVLLYCMPLVLAGSAILYFFAPLAIRIIAGSKYVGADSLLRLLLPVIVFSFPAMLVGWPALGAINKPKQTSFTTILAAVTQCVGLGFLIICGQFTLYGLAIVRSITEGVLLTGRGWLCFKYKKEFN